MENQTIKINDLEITIPEISLEEIEAIEADIERLRPRGKEASDLIPTLMSFVDLTSLEATDTVEKINTFASTAKSPHSRLPSPAATCVFPTLVNEIKDQLNETNINIATVAGGFPHGQVSSRVKFAEVAEAINAGADEIDLVCSRKLFYEKSMKNFFMRSTKQKKLCLEKNVHLKVILETGELIGPHDIYLASMLCLHAGADFIKTSTGKVTPAATIDSSIVMPWQFETLVKKEVLNPLVE